MLTLNSFARARCLSIWFIALLSCTAFRTPSHAAIATFQIEPQDLSEALKAFALQSHREIFFAPELVWGRRSQGVKGKLDNLKALNIILQGTGLNFSVTSSSAILLRDTVNGTGSAQPSIQNTPSGSPNDPSTIGGGKQSSQDFRVAQVDQNTAGSRSMNNQNLAKKEEGLAEIIVSAQKKPERLQDVPVPVTVIPAGTLVNSDQMRLQDYYSQVPGLIATPDFYGQPQLTLRGISPLAGNPSVGVTIDDVPFGSSSTIASGADGPEIDPSDLARIEVLRGPQGTLYGASSLGGLLKYVTLDPSTDSIGGRVQAGTSNVHNGVGLGYNVSASANVPLNDTIAIRVSGFSRDTPGYIYDVLTGQRGINQWNARGGMLSALWRPSGVWSLQFTTLLQHTSADGSSAVQPNLGDLRQSTVAESGTASRTNELYSLKLTAKLGEIDLTAISGYNILRFDQSFDYTSSLGGVGGPSYTLFDVTGVLFVSQASTNKFTQEIRLSGPIGESFEWLLGGFYNHEDSSRAFANAYAVVPTSGQRVGTMINYSYPSTYVDNAAFADLTFHFTDRFDIQLGGRENQNRQSYMEYDTGPLIPLFENSPSPYIYPEVNTQANSFTYLLTPKFKVSSDLMVYARVASGWRAGGPNIASGNFGFFQPGYKPDTTRNYEIGVKGDALDHSLSFDASLYHISWRDIQISLENPISDVAYLSNGSGAKSQGIELSVQSKSLTDLTISAWVALNDAELTRSFPSNATAVGYPGSRLPFSAKFTSNFSVEQNFPLPSRVTGFLGGTVSYVGDRTGNFASIYAPSLVRQYLPGYAKVDLRAGAKKDSWTGDLFVNNLSDKRGVLDGPLDIIGPPNSFFYIQPRTVGLSVTKTF